MRSSPPDLVVAYCSGMARFALEPPLAGLPFVLDMVDVDSAKWRQMAADSSGPRSWVYEKEGEALATFEATAAREARLTLVVNERERAALNAVAPGAQIAVVQNGIDLDAFGRPVLPARSRS